jgi:hypothetical protein
MSSCSRPLRGAAHGRSRLTRCIFMGRLLRSTFELQMFEHFKSGAFGCDTLSARAPKQVSTPTSADAITNAGNVRSDGCP